MEEKGIALHYSADDVSACMTSARRVLEDANGRPYSDPELRQLVTRVLADDHDRRVEELPQLFESAHPRYREMLLHAADASFLTAERRREGEIQPQGELFDTYPSIYNGYKRLDQQTLDAVAIHLAYRTKNLGKTKLNKMLFYSDFSYYCLHGRGMSGAEYQQQEHGPMLPGYDQLLDRLERRGRVRLKNYKTKTKRGTIILPSMSYRPTRSILGKEVLKFLDWVAETYGPLTTDEIIAMSHREIGYVETPEFDTIKYSYAENLEIKPPAALLLS